MFGELRVFGGPMRVRVFGVTALKCGWELRE